MNYKGELHPSGAQGGIAVGPAVRTGYDHRFGRIAIARCASGAVGVSGRRMIGRALKELNG